MGEKQSRTVETFITSERSIHRGPVVTADDYLRGKRKRESYISRPRSLLYVVYCHLLVG
jgi:hypothetical protein